MNRTTATLKSHFDTFVAEDKKFEAGNMAAGTRARKELAEMSKLIKERRVEIQEAKNAEKLAKAA